MQCYSKFNMGKLDSNLLGRNGRSGGVTLKWFRLNTYTERGRELVIYIRKERENKHTLAITFF